MSFPSLSSGDSIAPILSARRHNALNEVLAAHGFGAGGGPLTAPNRKRQNTTVLVLNGSTLDVPRGGLVGLGKAIIDADENEGEFAQGEVSFRGEKPKQADHYDRVAVAIDEVPKDKMRRFVISGWVQARVNVTDASHKYAQIEDDNVDRFKSSGSSGFRMEPAQVGTGEVWAMVLVGPSPPGVLVRAYLTADVPAASINTTETEITPGIQGVNTGCKVLRWKGTLDVWEVDDGVGDEGKVKAVNGSLTHIRASSSEPVLVHGILETHDGEDVLVVSNVMDFRGLPGYAKGAASGGGDDADMQIPYHAGGEGGFSLDSEDCA